MESSCRVICIRTSGRNWPGDAFYSLAGSESLKDSTTLLLLVKHGHSQEYTDPVERLGRKFRVILKTDGGLNGTEQTLAFGTQWLIDNFGLEYITWMGDDALFHPMWLWKLEGLIKRHPAAKSWSVYHSAYEFVHRTLRTEEDILVRSICGHGMTFSREEWKEWGIDWKKGMWCCCQGDTLDLCHSEWRTGERWVTNKSYIQHTGKVGVHCHEGIPEYAKDFEPV